MGMEIGMGSGKGVFIRRSKDETNKGTDPP